ncbi:MAG: hypothetical protein WDN44_08610 [Sphingomonas sp.]
MSYDTSVSKDTNGLALAMVASSNAPLLLLGGDLTVIAASASSAASSTSSRRTRGGRKLSELGHGEWALPQLERCCAQPPGAVPKSTHTR